jgi:hypothetical protein
MKKLLFILLFCLFTTNLFAAELLCRAKKHYLDDLTQSEVDTLTPEAKEQYLARSQIGDIVVVRPDGWLWGKEECLPNYVVVKVPQVTFEEAQIYEESLQDTTNPENPKLLRHRKYALPKADIETAKANKLNSITLIKSALTTKLKTKTGAEDEVIKPSKNIVYSYWRRLTKRLNPYLKTAFNFYVKKCYAAQFLYKTVKPSGGDYTSIEACLDANEQDLTGDGWFDVEIDGTWSSADTTVVTDNNYTTTSVDYINIYTTATARHKGVWSTSYYILSCQGLYGSAFTMTTNIRLTGIQISYSGASGSGYYGYGIEMDADTGETQNLSNCIIKSVPNSANETAIPTWNSNGGTVNIWNNVLYNTGRGINCGSYPAAYTINIFNNTFGYAIGDNITIKGGNPTYTLKNNLAQGGTTDYDISNATPVSADNIASDTSSPNNEWDSINVVFVNEGAGTEDFHLDATDTSGAVGGGTVDPGSGLFSDDIDGDARGAAWDIGADEYVSAGGAVTGNVRMGGTWRINGSAQLLK